MVYNMRMTKMSFVSTVQGSTLFLFNGYSQGINAIKEGNSEIRDLVDLRIRIDYVDWTLFLPVFQ